VEDLCAQGVDSCEFYVENSFPSAEQSQPFSNSQFPNLFDSQIQSLEAIENASQVATKEHRLATVAIVTPTSSGKDLLPLLWAVKKRGVSILFVPYVHLADAAIKYAEDFRCSVERFSSTKQTNNSAATCVICSYEVANQVDLCCMNAWLLCDQTVGWLG
jgi:hypothetical protein